MIYTDKDRLSAGVPLGGIGAGKLEIDNRVKIINVTITNNFTKPIKTLLGFHIFIKPEGERGFLFQRDSGLYRLKEFKGEVIYEGLYPFVFIRGKEIELEAFSPIILHDLKNSSLPAAGLKLRIKGSNGIVAVSFPNIVGSINIGRVNERAKEGVVHKNVKANNYDPAKGNTALISDHADYVITQYNLKRKPSESPNFWISPYENDEPWLKLENGEMPRDDPHEVTGYRDDPASIIISNYRDREEIKYVFAWYFTGKHVYYPYGHYYENFFRDSLEVARYFMENFDFLREKTKKEFHDYIKVEGWLKDAIINSAYILSSSTILDEKGRFGIYEAPQSFPFVGTIGTCYEFGSLPVILFYPELEKSFLTLLRSYIREDGYVPHDLGYSSLDSPSDGTTSPPRWKDTNPTFILLVYRYYKMTGDVDFLKETYPLLMKVLKWEFEHTKDGLPFLEGEMDNAFDSTIIKGHDSYTSSLFIASLIAMREIAKLMKDEETVKFVEEKLKEARESFKKMFNGKYFIPWEGEDGCFTAQVFGEWWTQLLGLESIVDEEMVKKALECIVKVNGRVSPYCVPNLVKDGKIVQKSVQTYSSWPRMTFAICWLAYKKGVKEALEMCKKEWGNLVRIGHVWDQPSRINGFSGKPELFYLDHYIGSPAIWSFLF